MRFLYLTCACLVATLSLSAQQNFIPGTVTFPNGDSARGLIDYRKWDKSPLQIVFRDGGGAEKTYKPEDIKGFRVAENEESYLSINARMDVTKETVDVLSDSRERDWVSGAFFFRVLMNGPVKLLVYADRNSREHFAVVEKDSVTQLVKKVVYVHDQDSPDYSKLMTHYFYRQQLANIAGKCVAQQKVLRLDYSEKDIRKILQQYVTCRYPGEQVTLRKEDRQTKATFGVMAGGSMNFIRFTGDHPLARGKYDPTFSPVAGIFLDIPISRNRQKFSWNNEVVYTSRPMSSSFMRSGLHYEADIDLQYIQIQTLVKYTYPKGKLRPYANVGVAGAISIGGKDELRRIVENSSFTPEPEKALDGGREFFLPVLTGVGVRYEKLHAELRYTFPHNISPFLALNSHVMSLQLLVRYTLF
ncbi:outer membrane beta-barrel protein [Chitinophaga sp. GCM10012297]|uniref:Outer membrane beta-barrel protein n=1 Tax=Chitinophaga chungangae TaxID=2821488 RepID=A0ABS3YCL8_9BACT|nr:outer membrane beta-barrel protein [Chitinophaga chungangae]MBO9152432.1 outer membrane beta-barrel protein [Chitinophaga chungangae]